MRLWILAFISQCVFCADYWVSPTGSDANPGTYAQPWALTKIARTARGATPISAVSAGDTVWIRGGIYDYNQELFVDVVGTADNYITLRFVPGERAYLRATQMGFPAQLQIGGSYVQIIGLEVGYDGPRIETAGGSNPAVQVPAGFNVSVQLLGNPTGVRLINCWSHGNSGTISATSSDYGTLYYGGINFDQGSDGPDRLHGGYQYQQNNIANGTETLSKNVSLQMPYWYNMRIYTSSGTTSGISITDSIYYGGEMFLWTGDSAATDVSIAGNLIATGSYIVFGIAGSPVSNFSLTNNYILSYSTRVWTFPSPVITGNTMENTGDYALNVQDGSGAVITGNSFLGGVKLYGTHCSSANWDACGIDQSNTLASAAASNWVNLYPNEYEAGRAHIGIYNWTAATSQSVDVSSVLNVGDRYELLDLWTPLSAPVASGTYAGGSIDVPLTGADYYTPWGLNGNASRPRACWEVDRASCLTSGDYTVAAGVDELPAGTTLYQPALLSSDYAVYYWSGSAWTSASVTMATHAGPEYKREANAHAFLLRRVYDGRADTTLTWRGAITDTVEAGTKGVDGTYHWGRLPVHSIACTDGRCTARAPQPVGDAYWRINDGAALRMAAR